MKTRMLILVLNPGSVSTKVAVYDGENELSSRTLEHSAQELDRFSEINEQLDFRKEMVLSYLREAGFCPEDLSAIACRGGVIGQLDPGAYLVDEKVVAASRNRLRDWKTRPRPGICLRYGLLLRGPRPTLYSIGNSGDIQAFSIPRLKCESRLLRTGQTGGKTDSGYQLCGVPFGRWNHL